MARRNYGLYIATFPYAGNSTGSSINWPTCEWLVRSMLQLRTDQRYKDIQDIWMSPINDTPITMSRNRAVRNAQNVGADFLLMVDSDMGPDYYPQGEPFLQVALNKCIEHYDKGPLVIGAPYGGAPPHENMFVFTWAAKANLGDESAFELRQYTREEARSFKGLMECNALPTGLILYDLRAFDYIEPPYFQYEWEDDYATAKASTEDVQNTRDIGLAVQAALGYNPLLCAWDSWAAHYKVWPVGKPTKFTTEHVSKHLQAALSRKRDEVQIDASQLCGEWS